MAQQKMKMICEAFSCLDDLIGMENVKEKLMQYYLGASLDGTAIPGCYVFSGNPGTGKTAVAYKMGQILKEAGILASGHVVHCTKADLVACYVGQTAIATRATCERALDGVLLVGDAYSLVNQEQWGGNFSSSFEREAFMELLSCMDRYRNRICFIFEGYPKEMAKFLTADPGMRARLTRVVEFPDYSEDELVEILGFLAKKRGFTFGPGLEEAARKVFADLKRDTGISFGNAREAYMLLNVCIAGASQRLLRADTPEVQPTLLVEDIPAELYHPVSEQSIRDALAELDEVVGPDDWKQTMRRVLRMQLHSMENEPGNYAFIGNAGTDKTKAARLMGTLFKSAGVLKKGHVVQVTPHDLIAAFVGQTTMKTMALCRDALGGILYVDGANMLDSRNPFALEAFNAILRFMVENRHNVCVIFADCEEPMMEFLARDPALNSRITSVIHFPDHLPVK